MLRNGALAFQRLGHLSAPKRRHVRAASIRRPPERRGLWAFPFGYFDMFYAAHKYDEVLPKRLRRTVPDEEWPEDGFERRQAWIREQGPKALPLRTFWVNGPVWSRFAPNGDDAGPIPGPDDWFLIPLEHYVEAARRIVPPALDRESGRMIRYARPSDQLEVFIPLRHIRD